MYFLKEIFQSLYRLAGSFKLRLGEISERNSRNCLPQKAMALFFCPMDKSNGWKQWLYPFVPWIRVTDGNVPAVCWKADDGYT